MPSAFPINNKEMPMNATLKSNLLSTLIDSLFFNVDKLSETTTNQEAVDMLFEIKMRLMSELRNLLNACSSTEDIIYLMPDELKDIAIDLGYTFATLEFYEPTALIVDSLYLAEKVTNSVKEQRILEMLIT
jgi:hypothetical protein